jgi:hypothetical protein
LSISNPYLTGDEDADLFEDDSKSGDNRAVGFIGSDGGQVPEELAEALRKYVGEEVALGATTIPVVVSVMSEMQSFFSVILNEHQESPVVLALYDVVNHMSEGVLDKYIDYYESRQKIIVIHTIKFYSNILLQMTEASKSEEDYDKIVFYLSNYNDYIDWKLNNLKNSYLIQCENLGIEPDEKLLAQGEFDDKISQILYKPSYSMKILKEKLSKKDNQNDSNLED